MSCLLLKNADVYAPEPLGLVDVLIVNDKIVKIAPQIQAPAELACKVLDVGGRKVVPGYVDQHVHIIGGGGESGPYSRTPEIFLSELTRVGITTVIGVLGTDGTTRHSESLLAKARALTHEGITAYMLTGSYELPLHTITDDARRDIILINECLGIGEVALSDHRSSQPTRAELEKLLTQARLGGMLSGKAGVVQFHMGVGERGISVLMDIARETEIPAKHFIPTHINRSAKLFEQAKEFARLGGYVDITSGIREQDGFPVCVKPSEAIKILYEEGVPMDRVTMSSDANGCMSITLPDGMQKQLAVSPASFQEEVRDAVLAGVPLPVVLQVVCTNPAKANGLYPQKGAVRVGSDADIIIYDGDYGVDTVIAKGNLLVEAGTALVKGTFER
ncbi:MAG: beta-aspartyl-peptidase [Phascolarctobacterium sp.]|uniref:beta-aspartyl-peptidase n=1 Tax=Phascolarctobacterium sp. TaxID=2049039 RepID=UPI0026DC8F1B|nr:beta-aspartyl-peptidase [Phascolarctobacterium sp.]MDO4921524.1 beta-aspartyl-peptidase [Phascolarctobacterium sp.]